MMNKLNVGCGNEILQGYINIDVVPLDGVDVVHNLSEFPWPFEDNRFEDIRMINILEHLPDTVKTMEEIWRISKSGSRIVIRVPYWNCWKSIADPTHKTFFHEKTFEFFDPRKRPCQERPYYTNARFEINKICYWLPLCPFGIGTGWVKVRNKILMAILHFLAFYFNNIIWMMELDLCVLKDAPEVLAERH